MVFYVKYDTCLIDFLFLQVNVTITCFIVKYVI